MPKTIIDTCKLIRTEKLQVLFPSTHRIKFYLRSRMTDDRLNRLPILSIVSALYHRHELKLHYKFIFFFKFDWTNLPKYIYLY